MADHWSVAPAPIARWAHLAWPAVEPDVREARVRRLEAQCEAGTSSPRFWWGLFAAEELVAATHLDPMGGDEIECCQVVGDHARAGHTGLAAIFGVVAAVLDALDSVGVHRAETSIVSNAYDRALASAGFGRVGERAEFRRTLTDLPTGPTRLRWRSMDADLDLAASTLARVAVGDPHHRSDDAPRAALSALLDDPVLTGGDECVQLGYLADEVPVAIVVPQINPATGWSRLGYLGVVPEHRGVGLGAEVHRHGLQCLLGQGGTHYHGGTAIENEAMRRLFAAHGCEPFRALVDWRRPRRDAR